MQYYSSAVQARSILHPEIVRHIERCFTKKGMKEFKAGRKKRAYPKRNQIIKVGAEYFNNMRSQAIKQEYVEDDEKYEGSEEEEEEDDVDEVEEQAVEVVENIPTDQEMKSSLALSVLGTELPEVRRRARPPREGLSDRKGRGGRNEKEREPAQYVAAAAGLMLDTKENPAAAGTISLTSLFKKRTRRKKKRLDVDAFSDEDDYKAPPNMLRSSHTEPGQRKSKRMQERYCEVRPEDVQLPGSTDQSGGESWAPAPAPAPAPADSSSESDKETRQQQLDQVRQICAEQLGGGAATFREPGAGTASSGEEERPSRQERSKRGHGKAGGGTGSHREAEEVEVTKGELTEMIRCVSRNSRPGSSAGSRPASRAASALPKLVSCHHNYLLTPIVLCRLPGSWRASGRPSATPPCSPPASATSRPARSWRRPPPPAPPSPPSIQSTQSARTTSRKESSALGRPTLSAPLSKPLPGRNNRRRSRSCLTCRRRKPRK